jgi:hypothetical protein
METEDVEDVDGDENVCVVTGAETVEAVPPNHSTFSLSRRDRPLESHGWWYWPVLD